MHTAFALHDLKNDGAYVVIGESRFERCDIILRNIDESARQRLEGLLLQRLRGGSERCERAAVEAVRDGDDGRAAVAETLRVETRELDGAFVGFCARIREERLPLDGLARIGGAAQNVRQLLGDLAAVLDVVIVADVHELGSLFLQGFYERGCAVAQTNNADAANEIEVLFAFVIGEHHAVSAHEFDRLAGEDAHARVWFVPNRYPSSTLTFASRRLASASSGWAW